MYEHTYYIRAADLLTLQLPNFVPYPELASAGTAFIYLFLLIC